MLGKDPKVDPCPIDTAHRRLNDARLAINEVMVNYQDPIKIVSKLNNALQCLRNITNVLQHAKNSIPDFNIWYPKWDSQMKNDSVMNWLIKSRNIVVHEGDLKTKSVACVSVLVHDKYKLLELSFDPFSKFEEIANGITKFGLVKLPPELSKEAVLLFERKWVVDAFPKADLIDLLIYVYGALLELIVFTHEKHSIDFFSCKHTDLSRTDALGILYILHNEAKEYKYLRVRCSDMAVMHTTSRNLIREMSDESGKNIKPELIRRMQEHYGNFGQVSKEENPLRDDSFPFCYAEFHIRMAKFVLKTDKYLLPTAFLFTEGKKAPYIICGEPKDRSELYVFLDEIADKVEEISATSIIFVDEAYNLSQDDPDAFKIRPSESKYRTESINITIASPKKTVLFSIPYSRDVSGEIIFGKTSVTEKIISIPFFERIYRIWTRMNTGQPKNYGSI